jgi:glutamine synthetase
MSGVGIEVEGFHTEYGDGMYEFAIAHEPAVKAADSAARTKLHMKQYCHELGLVPTFMAAVHPDAINSMIGCHHNVSLWKDGKNAFWDSGTATLSSVGRHFAAGALQTMADYHLLFKPWPNSYHRMDPDKWCPVNVSWGLDNHSAAIRVVHGAQPEKHTRLEHRVSSTDINPYLTIAAILSGGLYGIKNGLEPPRYASKKIAGDGSMPLLQTSMQDSINAFAGSDAVRESFGEALVKHIVTVKTAEWEEYLRWCSDNNHDAGNGRISRWELERYFLWI